MYPQTDIQDWPKLPDRQRKIDPLRRCLERCETFMKAIKHVPRNAVKHIMVS